MEKIKQLAETTLGHRAQQMGMLPEHHDYNKGQQHDDSHRTSHEQYNSHEQYDDHHDHHEQQGQFQQQGQYGQGQGQYRQQEQYGLGQYEQHGGQHGRQNEGQGQHGFHEQHDSHQKGESMTQKLEDKAMHAIQNAMSERNR